jgi:hypothetical protein
VPLLVALEGIDGLRLVSRWLTLASSPNRADGRRSYDQSYLWRPSIAPHEQNARVHVLPDALIDATRDVALRLGSAGEFAKVTRFLNGSKLFLLRRIGLEVVSQILAEDHSRETVAVGHKLIMDSSLINISARPEYVHLALSLLPHLSHTQRQRWVELVLLQEWQGSDATVRRIAAWPMGDPSAVTADDAAETRARMLQRLLQPIGSALPKRLGDELTKLVSERGAIDHPEFATYVESFTGPTSPVTSDQLAKMTPVELSSFLRAWEPTTERSFGPSVEGLARALQEVAAAQPQLLEGLADDLIMLGRSYVRAVLTGWSRAIATGHRPSEAAWQLVSQVADMTDDGTESDSDFDSDDALWRYAQRSAIDFIAAYLKSIPSPASSTESKRLWKLLRPLTTHPDPTPAHEARFGGSNMDPLTLSLNTTRPAALRVAISLLAPSHAPSDSRQLIRVKREILAALSEHIGARGDPSLAAAAVIGEGLGRVWHVDPSWVETRSELLFAVLDDDAAVRTWADVLVSVALRAHQTTSAFLDLIRPALALIFTSRYGNVEHTDGWTGHRSTPESAALHLLNGYLMSLLGLDDPLLVQLFSGQVANEVTSAVLGDVGWQLMRGRAVEGRRPIAPEVISRAQQLIDWRVAEIRGGRAAPAELASFGWWVQSDIFEPSWWLPILLLATESQAVEPKGMIGKPLIEAVKTDPKQSLEIFQRLVAAHSDDSQEYDLYDLIESAPSILAGALISDDHDAKDIARTMLDTLGRRGYTGVLRDVEQLMSGQRTASSER